MLNFVDVEILDARTHVGTSGTSVVFVWQPESDQEPVINIPELIKRDCSSQEVFDGNKRCDFNRFLKAHKFSGELGKRIFLPAVSIGDVEVLFVGLGKKSLDAVENIEAMRSALGSVVQCVKEMKIEDVSIFLQSIDDFKNSSFDSSTLMADLIAYINILGYEFNDFKSKKSQDSNVRLKFMLEQPIADNEKAVREGMAIGHYVNFARRLADYPPNVASPEYIASEVAKKAHGKEKLSFRVIEHKEAKELGMGGFCAVGSGSKNDSKFVIMEYKSGVTNAKKVALVGKGVTFDTGGVSLKPADSMTGMKYDMSGAAAVMSTIILACEMSLPVDLVAVAPLVENMPDGGSYRQDDIVTFYNGKTAEIVNTDAEGRVILADALAWVEKNHQPAQIIDVATLTGACIVALGSVYAGVMGSDSQLISKLIQAGEPVGELLWQLPMHKDYAKGIESKHADISNCGAKGFGAGTITAAWFLKNFVEHTPWAHLDIAGKDSMVRGSAHASGGASGFGIRLLVNYLRGL